MLSYVLGLGLPGLALAHRPHTVITAMAVDPDIETTGRAWLVLDPHDISGLMYSEDGGLHWDFLGGDPQNDELVGGGYAADTLVLVAEHGRIWTSAGGTGPWESTTLPWAGVQDLDLSATDVMVATDFGLLVGSLDDLEGMSAQLADEEISAAAFAADDPEVMLAGDRGGRMWRSVDHGASFPELPPLPGDCRLWDIAEVGGVVYAGTDLGLLALIDDDWVACGELPRTILGGLSGDVPLVRATADGLLYATTGEEALFVSEDACASWTLLSTGVDVSYGGIGEASSADQAFTEFYQGGSRILIGGYQGASLSTDAGATWVAPQLLPEDYSRGLALAPDFPNDPTVLVGGYGGGVVWTTTGGSTWEGSAVGLDAGYSYDVTARSDFSESGVLYYSGSNVPYVSRDFGQSWEHLDIPMSRARRFRSFNGRDYVLGEDQEVGDEIVVIGRIARSLDDGRTWTTLAGFDALEGGPVPRDVEELPVDGSAAILIVQDGPEGLLLSTDDGASFREVYQGTGQLAAGATAWPPGVGSRLVFASGDSGVLWSDDGGESWTAPAVQPQGTIREMIGADDGTMFVVTRIGQFWRSVDGGEVWEAVGDPIRPAVFRLVVAPNFAENPVVAVGTQEGIYWSWDAGETWQVMPRFQRFDDVTHYLACTAVDGGACASVGDRTANFGSAFDLALGDTVAFTFKGSGFQALTRGTGSMEITANGAAIGTVSIADAPTEVIAVPDGWNDVVLTVRDVGAGGLRLDTVDVFGAGVAMPIPEVGDSGADDSGADDSGADDSGVDDSGVDSVGPDSVPGGGEPPCGCGDDGGAKAALLGGLLLVARGRRGRVIRPSA